MAGGIITAGNHPKALWPGMKAWFGRQYDEHSPEYPDLFEVDTSTQSYEEIGQVTGFGLAPVKAEGASVQYDSETQGYITRATHVAYALGYIVTYEELGDNLYEVVGKRRARALAFSMRQTREIVGANIYNRGFNASYTYGDGSPMISLTHSTLSGSQSNHLTVAADLSETAIEDLCIQIMLARNDKNLRINLMPKSLHVHPNDWFEANRILKSVLQNDTANNAMNVLKAVNAIPGGIKVNHYFTDPDAWFIRTNCPLGQIHYEREIGDFENDNDFDTKNAKAMKYERYSFTSVDFRGVYGSPGA